MFKSMNEKELMNVNGGGKYVPKYDAKGSYAGQVWTSDMAVRYYRYEYRSGGYQWWPHY